MQYIIYFYIFIKRIIHISIDFSIFPETFTNNNCKNMKELIFKHFNYF